MFRAVAVHARETLQAPESFVTLVDHLRSCAESVALTEQAAGHIKETFPKVDFAKQYDFFVVFGGDGSVLHVVHRLQNSATPLLPISAGTLGFLAEIPPEDFAACCKRLAEHDYTLDERSLFDVVHISKDGDKQHFRALNEAVVSQRAVARMVSLKTLINDEYLTTYRADGVMVATPTGSTAYSLAAGGPIVYPRFDALLLTPVSPHSFSHRSLLLPPEKKVTIMPDDGNREPVMLTIDGQITVPLEQGDRVEITVAKDKITFLRMPDEHFLKTLKRKLHWGVSSVKSSETQ